MTAVEVRAVPAGRLVDVELRRFAARRLIRVTGAIAVGLPVLVLAIQALNGKDLDPGTHLRDALVPAGFGLVLVAVALGAGSIGAEFAGGSFATLLTWEPRRTRVVLAKVAAAAVGCAVIAVAACAALIAVDLLAAGLGAHHPPTAADAFGQLVPLADPPGPALDGAWALGRVGDVARIASAAGLAGALGVAWTAVVRYTAGPAVTFLVLAVGGEKGISAIVGGADRWLPAGSLIRYAAGQDLVLTPDVTTGRAGTVALAWVVVSALAAVAVVRRREIR